MCVYAALKKRENDQICFFVTSKTVEFIFCISTARAKTPKSFMFVWKSCYTCTWINFKLLSIKKRCHPTCFNKFYTHFKKVLELCVYPKPIHRYVLPIRESEAGKQISSCACCSSLQQIYFLVNRSVCWSLFDPDKIF